MRDTYDINPGYYHLKNDLNAYPEAWCYVCWSARSQGKTYSALWQAYCEEIPIVYIKRTKDDVDLICNDNNLNFDASPYVPINRDHGTDIHAKKITSGIGGFYIGEEPHPISYVIALSAAKSVKGFDLSICDWMILDEFIPQVGEIVRRKEGDMVLDLYLTISRDREQRGRMPLKLILFANAEDISTPVTNTLEIVDTMSEMNVNGNEYHYDTDRGILLHRIPNQHSAKTDHGGIYNAMKDTTWGKKSFGGEFSHNDFSCVQKMSLKGCVPWIQIHYKSHDYYIYRRNSDGFLYMCTSRGSCLECYDLDREVEQKRFFSSAWIDINRQCIDGRMYFQKYSMYDLMTNYRSFFKV